MAGVRVKGGTWSMNQRDARRSRRPLVGAKNLQAHLEGLREQDAQGRREPGVLRRPHGCATEIKGLETVELAVGGRSAGAAVGGGSGGEEDSARASGRSTAGRPGQRGGKARRGEVGGDRPITSCLARLHGSPNASYEVLWMRSSNTLPPLVSKDYSPRAFFALVIWLLAHLSAAPETPVSILWGLVAYTKKRVSFKTPILGREATSFKPHRTVDASPS